MNHKETNTSAPDSPRQGNKKGLAAVIGCIAAIALVGGGILWESSKTAYTPDTAEEWTTEVIEEQPLDDTEQRVPIRPVPIEDADDWITEVYDDGDENTTDSTAADTASKPSSVSSKKQPSAADTKSSASSSASVPQQGQSDTSSTSSAGKTSSRPQEQPVESVPQSSSTPAQPASNNTAAPAHVHSWSSYETITKMGYYDTVDKGTTRKMLYVYDANGNKCNEFLPGNSADAQKWADGCGGYVKEVDVKNTCTLWYSPVYEYGKRCSCGEKQVEGTKGGTKTVISGHA